MNFRFGSRVRHMVFLDPAPIRFLDTKAQTYTLLPQLLGSPSGILKMHLNHYIPSPSSELFVQRWWLLEKLLSSFHWHYKRDPCSLAKHSLFCGVSEKETVDEFLSKSSSALSDKHQPATANTNIVNTILCHFDRTNHRRDVLRWGFVSQSMSREKTPTCLQCVNWTCSACL